jgi:hypothetical protein
MLLTKELTLLSSIFEGQKNLSGAPARLHWAAILYEACKSPLPELVPQDEVASALSDRNSVRMNSLMSGNFTAF